MTHPMLAQLKADAAAMVADQGEAATYAPSGGAAVAVSCVVDMGMDLGGQGPVGLSPEFGFSQGRWAVLLVHADALAARPVKDLDTVTLDGTDWTVRQVRPEMGGALWRLWCSADERGGMG